MVRVLITGVSGSVGHELARYLLECGYDVFGSVRSNRPVAALPPDRVISIDLADDREPILPDGLDAVIHCAAATSESTSDPAVSKRVNIDGVARLLRSCERSGVKRFVFFSTMSANADNPSAYAQTKLAGERLAQVANGSMETVILRPGLILTSGERGIFAKMRSYVEKLPVVPIIGTNDRLASISMPDLCRAAELAATVPGVAGSAMDVCADESLSLARIVRGIAAASSRSVRCITIPYGMALLIAELSRLSGIPILTKDNVYGLQYARAADTEPMRRLLGFTASPFEKTLAALYGQNGGRP